MDVNYSTGVDIPFPNSFIEKLPRGFDNSEEGGIDFCRTEMSSSSLYGEREHSCLGRCLDFVITNGFICWGCWTAAVHWKIVEKRR